MRNVAFVFSIGMLGGCSGGQAPAPEHPAATADSGVFCEGSNGAADKPLEFEQVGMIGDPAPTAIRQPAEIQRVIRTKSDDFAACFEAASARDPKAHHTVSTRLVIAAEGSTSDVCIVSSTLQDAKTLTCLVDQYSKLTFEPAAKQTTIVYPLEISPN